MNETNIVLTDIDEVIEYLEKNMALFDFHSQRSLNNSVIREKRAIRTIKLTHKGADLSIECKKMDGWSSGHSIELSGKLHYDYRQEQIPIVLEGLKDIGSDELTPFINAVSLLFDISSNRQNLRLIEKDGYPQSIDFRSFSTGSVVLISWKPKE